MYFFYFDRHRENSGDRKKNKRDGRFYKVVLPKQCELQNQCDQYRCVMDKSYRKYYYPTLQHRNYEYTDQGIKQWPVARLGPERRTFITNLVYFEVNTTYEVEILRQTSYQVFDFVAYEGN